MTTQFLRPLAWMFLLLVVPVPVTFADAPIRVGVAAVDITPPVGFPMAGYYHERLAEGTIDPLHAKAVVFRDETNAAAWVVCDLIGISTDLSRAVREAASQQTGIPAAHIVVSATHSHTAPDYIGELYRHLGGGAMDPLRKQYIEKLISGTAAAIVAADQAAGPVQLEAGSATQETPVSFNRRFVMKDGSVRTWQSLENPDVLRAAGPIDPEISVLAIRSPAGQPLGILSNFALHLDTVGGMKWSADYPRYIEQTLRASTQSEVHSLFGTGCCGDINHVNPSRKERNTAEFIGTELGQSIAAKLPHLQKLESPNLRVQTRTVQLPLQSATADEVRAALAVLQKARNKEAVDFLDHVTAYKKVAIDHWRNRPSFAVTEEQITWGLSRSLAGIGEQIPVDVTTICLGPDVAIVLLPGEVFVDLGLMIKRHSPFRTTLVVELCSAVETIYVPHRAAYAGGSYEVTNSATTPGSGEVLVETALSLLREAATANAATP